MTSLKVHFCQEKKKLLRNVRDKIKEKIKILLVSDNTVATVVMSVDKTRMLLNEALTHDQ